MVQRSALPRGDPAGEGTVEDERPLPRPPAARHPPHVLVAYRPHHRWPRRQRAHRRRRAALVQVPRQGEYSLVVSGLIGAGELLWYKYRGMESTL